MFQAEQAKLVKTAGQTSEEQEITEEASEPASSASASQAELRIRMPDGQVRILDSKWACLLSTRHCLTYSLQLSF